MRVVACAFVALALGTITSGPAAAQCPGPECEDSRSGPPRYFTDRPTSDGPRQGFDGPPSDGPRQNFERPPHRGEPDGPRQDRAGHAGPRAWPAASDQGERRPDPSYRRVGPVTPSDSYRRFWDDRDDRPARRTVSRPPTPREAPPYRRITKPRMTPQAPHTAAGPGPGKVTISVAEYRALQDQARELQRLLGRRSDFREGPRRDFRDRDERPGPHVIYR